MDMLSNVKSGYEGILSSLGELGALNISYMEKIAEKQMDSSKYVADLGFSHMKKLVAVDGLEAAKSLPSSSMELSAQMAKKTMEDGKALMEFGSSYKSDVTAIFKKKAKKAQ